MDGRGIYRLRIDTSTWRDMKNEFGKQYSRSREIITTCQRFGYRKHGKIVEGRKDIHIIYHTFKYCSKGISIQYAKPRQRLFEGWFANDNKFLTVTRIIFEAPFAGQTVKGIHVGNTREEVLKAYGAAIPNNHQLCYDEKGIRFELDSDDQFVRRILIFSPV